MDLIILLLLSIGFIYLIIAGIKETIRIIRGVKNYFKIRDTLDHDSRSIFEYMMSLIIFIALIYLMDQYNVFSGLNITQNLTRDYDWLSFVGACISTITSAILLIVVTRQDREENNKILCKSQRPYLNVNFIELDYNEMKSVNGDIYMISNTFNGNEKIPTLKIMNAGETVSIIDVQKSYVKIKYELIERIENGESQVLKREKDIYMNSVIKRLAIPSNQTIYVCFNDEEFDIPLLIEKIRIEKSYIIYKDLFGYEYEDECILENECIEIRLDNKNAIQKNKKTLTKK